MKDVTTWAQEHFMKLFVNIKKLIWQKWILMRKNKDCEDASLGSGMLKRKKNKSNLKLSPLALGNDVMTIKIFMLCTTVYHLLMMFH